jgi:hypothetical protein
MTLAYRVWCALSHGQTAAEIARLIGEPLKRVNPALNRMSVYGYAAREQKSRGPGHPTIWCRTDKIKTEWTIKERSVQNLKLGPAASAGKSRGKKRTPEFGAKISVSKKLANARRRFKKVKLPMPKCTLAALWVRA